MNPDQPVALPRPLALVGWAYELGAHRDRPIPADEIVARAASLGFAAVELAGAPDEAASERLAARAAASGVGLACLAPDLAGQRLLNTRDTGDYVQAIRAACAVARALGITRLRLDTLQPPDIHRQADYRDLFDRLVTTWDRCLGLAGDLGLSVVWEFDAGHAFNRPSDVQRILDRLQHDHFGVLYDTAEAELVAVVGAGQEGKPETLQGGQLELIRRLSGRIAHVHLADGDGSLWPAAEGEAAGARHLVPGQGRLDLAGLIAALAREEPAAASWALDLSFCPHAWDVTDEAKAALDPLLRATA